MHLPCPFCGLTDGFHDEDAHNAQPIDAQYLYTPRKEPSGRTVWPTGEPIMETVWRRPNGLLLPHLRKQPLPISTPEPAEPKLRIYVDTRDWWIGYYRSDTHHYVCILPTVVIRWKRGHQTLR